MRFVHAIVLASAAFLLSAGSIAGFALAESGGQSEQVNAGMATYSAKCSACHSDTMREGGHGPALAGASFKDGWAGQSARDLYRRIVSTMPAGASGTLTPQEGMSLVAAILAANGQELPAVASPTQLDSIVISGN